MIVNGQQRSLTGSGILAMPQSHYCIHSIYGTWSIMIVNGQQRSLTGSGIRAMPQSHYCIHSMAPGA